MRVLLFLTYDRVVADMTQHDWFQWYIANDAFWQHDGDMSRPHAETTSGLHTGTIFNSRILIENEPILELAVRDLVDLGEDFSLIHTVVGPQTGATKLAIFISNEISRRNNRSCNSASPSKQNMEGKKSMVFPSAEIVHLVENINLLCEDVVTTGGSINLTEQAVLELGGHVSTTMLVLVNRSGEAIIGDKKVVSLIDFPSPVWIPEECPYCKKNSLAIRPKDPKNWALLKGRAL